MLCSLHMEGRIGEFIFLQYAQSTSPASKLRQGADLNRDSRARISCLNRVLVL